MRSKHLRYELYHGTCKAFKTRIQVQSSTTFSSINEMKRNTEHLHKDLLEMISAVSDGTASDRSSSVCWFSLRRSK
jgi:hypothetical protein